MRDRFVLLLCLINLRNKRDDNKVFRFFLWIHDCVIKPSLIHGHDY